MQHLDDGYLQSWLDRDRSGLTGAEAAEVEAHVADCEACAARLAELEETSGQVRSLLVAAGPGAEQAPDFDAVVRRSRQREPSGRSGRGWMAAGWAASIVFATGLGWMTHDLVRPGAGDRASTPAAEARDMDTAGADVAAAEWAAGETAGREGREVVSAEQEGVAVSQERAAADQEERVADRADQEAAVALSEDTAVSERDIVIAPTTFADADRAAEGAGEPGRPLFVKGRVSGPDGRPLAGVQVLVPGAPTGSPTGTLTGGDGRFTLSVPSGAGGGDPEATVALSAQFLGYRTATREVDPGAADSVSVDFVLQEAPVALDRMVVTDAGRDAATTGFRERQEGVAAAALGQSVADAAGQARTLTYAISSAREVWIPVPRVRAEAEAEFALLTVPELVVLEIELGEVGGVTAVRVRQALESGAMLTLVQSRVDGGEVDPTPPEGQAVVRLERGEVRVTGAAPVGVDSLRVLLEAMR